MDFDVIRLSRKELRRLEKLARSPEGLPRAPEDGKLVNARLITCVYYRNKEGASSLCFIEESGKQYLAYLQNARKRASLDSSRFWLSTLLAILALLMSAAALAIDLWQLGLL